jgi:8-oxo-dGTP pyrophosphatase MutT (NUDIX family)
MARKYEVHIDGKVLIIGDPPDFVHLPDNWLAIRVEHAATMKRVVERLASTAGIVGAHAFGPDPGAIWQWFRQGYHPVEAAGGAVTDERGRLLAIHRLGRWDLPKGKVEPGEGVEEAALREVREECGLVHLELQGPLCRTWHTYPRGGREHLKCTHWFQMAGRSSDPLVAQAEEDIDAARWLDAEGVARMRHDTYPSLQRVLNAWEQAQCRPA